MGAAFEGKTVWITGASSGIGEALAREFARAGAKLILSARRAELLESVAASCGAPEKARALPFDMADHDAIPARAEEAASFFGPIDILVNNAGITQRSLGAETKLAVDKRLMDVNYFGTLAVTRAVLPGMIARREGQVVVVTSVLGKFGAMQRSGYAASKHALHGFFDALRAELHPHNVRVTILAPGWIRTEIAKTALEADGSPHGRIDRPGGGMPPAVFARRAMRAIRKQKREAVIGGLVEVLGVCVHRFFPGLFARVVRSVRLDPDEKKSGGA